MFDIPYDIRRDRRLINKRLLRVPTRVSSSSRGEKHASLAFAFSVRNVGHILLKLNRVDTKYGIYHKVEGILSPRPDFFVCVDGDNFFICMDS